MGELVDAVADLLERTPEFSGVVRVDVGGEIVVAEARGLADRANGVPNTIGTRFGVASVTKTFTGLTVVSLIADGVLSLDTTARSLLGGDLPLIDGAVTVGQLLAHRSGIGDYLDEEQLGDMTDYAMTVPVHQLDSAESFLAVLDGFPQVSAPGTTCVYNNGGFVVLALLAERAAGQPYHDLVRQRVCRPAGLAATDFVRSDEMPAGVATGYLHADGLRSNILHLPVLGVGDGGITSSADDLHRLWAALRAGRVVPPEWAARVTSPSGDFAEGEHRCGLGVWMPPTGAAAIMEGYDAGISARSIDDPVTGVRSTIISNWTDGAWPIAKALPDLVADVSL
jgi:CubicO group peptidase (beta-lactamase class C family)